MSINHAIVANAPALNIDPEPRYRLHRDPVAPEGRRPLEPVGSGERRSPAVAQIVTGRRGDHSRLYGSPRRALSRERARGESNSMEFCSLRARTRNGRDPRRWSRAGRWTPWINQGSSRGMTTRSRTRVDPDYDVDQAINLDGRSIHNVVIG